MNKELKLSTLLKLIPTKVRVNSKYLKWSTIDSSELKSMVSLGQLNEESASQGYLQSDISYWSKEYPISFAHYPNSNAQVFRDSDNYYLVYKDFGGHAPEFRCRLIQRNLIVNEKSENPKTDELVFTRSFESNERYIQEFEEQYSITIPKEYGEFLRKYGGGVPLKNRYYKELESKGVFDFEISAFYGNSEDTSLDLGFYYIMTLGIIPRGLLPIADDGIGNHICIGHSGKYINAIYIVWDTETEQLDNVVKLEDTLVDFIRHLK